RSPVGCALTTLHGVPAAHEVPVFVEDGYPVQPFVGHVHVPLGIDDKTRRPDQLPWLAAVPAKLAQVFFFSRLAAQGDLANPLAYTRAIPWDVTDALTSPVGHVYHAVRVQSHGYRVVKPHADRGASPHVVAIVIGSSCDRFRKHDTPPY